MLLDISFHYIPLPTDVAGYALISHFIMRLERTGIFISFTLYRFIYTSRFTPRRKSPYRRRLCAARLSSTATCLLHSNNRAVFPLR